MNNFNFPSFQQEVSIVDLSPSNMLLGFDSFFKDDKFKEMSIQEKLLIVDLDRDGHIFSKVKPSPTLLVLMKEHKMFVEAFSFYNGQTLIYSCFLKFFREKSSIKNHKDFKTYRDFLEN